MVYIYIYAVRKASIHCTLSQKFLHCCRWNYSSVPVIDSALFSSHYSNIIWRWCRASCPRMSVDILGTNCDQCRSMVQCCFTSTETLRLIRTESPGQPPRLSHSSWSLTAMHPEHWLNLYWLYRLPQASLFAYYEVGGGKLKTQLKAIFRN